MFNFTINPLANGVTEKSHIKCQVHFFCVTPTAIYQNTIYINLYCFNQTREITLFYLLKKIKHYYTST